MASQASSDSVDKPPIRCSTTISGLSSSVTVHMPSGPLENHQCDQRQRQSHGLLRVLAIGDREAGQHQDQKAQAGGEVPMHHLLDGLVILERPVRKRLVDRVDVLGGAAALQVAITTRPVRDSPGPRRSGAPRRRARHDQREQHAGQRQAAEQKQTWGHETAADLGVIWAGRNDKRPAASCVLLGRFARLDLLHRTKPAG